MSIVVVIRHYYPFKSPSGVISLTREFTEELNARGCDISVVCVKNSMEKDFYENNGIKIYKFNQWNLFGYKKIMRRLNPTSVIFVSSMVYTYSVLFWWLPLSLLTLTKSTIYYQATNPISFTKSFLMKWLLNSFSYVVCGSSAIARVFEKQFNVKSECIYPGVKLSSLRNFSRSDNNSGIKSVAFMGHLTRVKGPDHILDLAVRFPELTFNLIAGRPKKSSLYEKELITRIERMENVTWYGFVENPLELLSHNDIMILPYRSGATVLGTAQSAIEAMGMGIPVIGTYNEALKDLVKDGVNGFLCRDISEIGQKLHLLINDNMLYNDLAENAKRTVEQDFTITKFVNKLERIIDGEI